MWASLIRAAALVAVLLLSACGGGGSGGDGDPASAVPADALFYAEFVVRPEGSQREDALDAAGKLLRTGDPEARIRALMREAAAAEGEDFDYDRDLEPWLGERAGIWVGATGEKDDFGVILLEATDFDLARQALRVFLEHEGKPIAERSHRGVEYLVNSEQVAAGIVGDFAAFGREADLRRTIDASEGESLAEADAYEQAIDGLEEERLAHFWADTRRLVELAARGEELGALVPLDSLRPVVGAFMADDERLAIEAQSEAGDQGPGRWLGAGPTPLVQELPADSWIAGGSADAGESLRSAVDQMAGAIGGIALRRELRNRYGLDLDRDVLDWVGHTAFFVRGTTPTTIDGGLVIQPTDEDRAADAFGRIVGAIQRAAAARARPVEIAGADQAFELAGGGGGRPIVLARGSGLVVAAFGVPAAEAALNPAERLGDTDAYGEAEELVGMEPGLVLSMPAVLELVDAAGGGSEPDFAEVRPYLEAVSVIAAGSTADGDEIVARIAAGLR